MIYPFTPGATVKIAASTTTARGSVGAGTGSPRQMRIVSYGTGVGFYKTGNSVVDATTSDTPFLLGSNVIFTITGNTADTHVAIILNTGVSSTDVWVTLGTGA